MDENDKCVLSVIIPVYNVRQYLARCLASIVQQNINDMEVILVNDGSTDESGIMCDEWAKKDARIRVIHKKNEGPGYARNSGLAIATGQYVTFVDSDDYIAVDAYTKVLNRISNTDADVCYYGSYRVTDNNSLIKTGSPPKQLVYQGKEILTEIVVKQIIGRDEKDNSLSIGIAVFNGFYSRKLLNKHSIRFLSERDYLSEDTLFNLDVCTVSSKVLIYPDYLYYYCSNNDCSSLSKKYRENYFDANLRMFNKFQNRLRQMNLYEIGHERSIRTLLINSIIYIRQEVAHEKIQGKADTLKKIQRICEDETVQSALSEYRIQKLPFLQYLLFAALKLRQVKVIYLLVKMRYFLI